MSTLRKALVVLLLGCLLLVSVPLGTGQSSSAATLSADTPTARDTVPNQLLLGFRPGLSERERDASIAQRGGHLLQWFASSNTALISLPAAGANASAVSAFAVDDAVLYAEPNARIYPARTPEDPRYPPANPSDSASGQWALSKIGAPEAWETTTGSPDQADGSSTVVVGVVDSGVDYTHPDLAANIWSAPAGWNLNGCPVGSHGYRSDPSGTDCNPIDEFYHGTHVAGIIGAVGNNGVGVAGVNWQTSIMALRVFDPSGNGDTAGAVAAIDYAVQAKKNYDDNNPATIGANVRVLNISWTTPTYSQSLYNQIIAAGEQNILVVAAAGNDGKDNATQNVYPANFGTPTMLVVAATDTGDSLATYDVGNTHYGSNYSATRVHLGAPGKDILSTFPGDDYGLLSGTSMATPFVAGAAALLLAALASAAAPIDLSAAQLRDRLSGCGDPVAALAGKTISGRRLNIAHAISGSGCAAPTPSYALTLDRGSGGTATASPAPGSYPLGTQVQLTAVPDAGYSFAGWTIDGEAVEATNPYPLGLYGPRHATPVFLPAAAVPQRLALTPAVAGAGGGPLTLAIAGENFLPGVTVIWNDGDGVSSHEQALSTTFISTTRIEITVPATLLAAPTTAQLTIANPAPSSSPSPAPSATPSPSPSDTPSPPPSEIPSPSPTPTPTPSPSATPSPAPNPPAHVEFKVLPGQQITFDRPADSAYGAVPFTISPTLSPSGLPLTFATNGICIAMPAANSATITIMRAGRCAITVTQDGDVTHAPAPPVTQEFFIDKGQQSIAFGMPLPSRTLGAAPFTLSATASSGLGVSFSVPGNGPCTLNGATITLATVGTCTITARQSGNGNFYAAQDIVRSFTILAPSPSPTPSPTPSTLLPSPSNPASPTPAPVPVTYTLVTAPDGPGRIAADKPDGRLVAGTVVTLNAVPIPGQVFIGWVVDDVLRSYANPVRLTMNSNHTVVARFVAQPSFVDTPADPTAAEAIRALAARGVIHGCDSSAGLFCPDETTLRAQMAALITRAMGWDSFDLGNPFPDQNGVDNDLWRNVGTLASYGVAKGYDDPRGGKYFDPTGNVLAGQTISFITRAMIKKGYWQQHLDDGTAYTNVPVSSGHRDDIATYLFYVKSLPDFPNTSGAFTTWDQPSTRTWFARALWAALQSHFNVESLP